MEVVLLLLVTNTTAVRQSTKHTSKGIPWGLACPVISILPSVVAYQVDVYTWVTKRTVT